MIGAWAQTLQRRAYFRRRPKSSLLRPLLARNSMESTCADYRMCRKTSCAFDLQRRCCTALRFTPANLGRYWSPSAVSYVSDVQCIHTRWRASPDDLARRKSSAIRTSISTSSSTSRATGARSTNTQRRPFRKSPVWKRPTVRLSAASAVQKP